MLSIALTTDANHLLMEFQASHRQVRTGNVMNPVRLLLEASTSMMRMARVGGPALLVSRERKYIHSCAFSPGHEPDQQTHRPADLVLKIGDAVLNEGEEPEPVAGACGGHGALRHLLRREVRVECWSEEGVLQRSLC